MALTMNVLRCPGTVAPETRTLQGGEYVVGRGLDVDWTLIDTNQVISKRHFIVAFRAGGWQIADVSTNGTYLNHESQPIGQGSVRDLRDGDRVRVGEYEIEIGLEEVAQAGFGAAPGSSASPFGDPFANDPFSTPKARNAFDDPDHVPHAAGFGGSLLPDDFDPLGPIDAAPPVAPMSHHRTQSDHSSVLEDAFRPPAESGQMAFNTGGIIPAAPTIHDAWGDDFLSGIGTPAAVPPPSPVQTEVPAERPVEVPPAPAAEIAGDPFSPAPEATGSPSAEPPPRDVSPFFEPGVDIETIPPTPIKAIVPPAPPIAAAPPPQMPASAPGDDALMAAFMAGVGLTDVQPKDAKATMTALGVAFRALVSGIRAILIARAAIKSEFRIEQTMIRASGNNPLKFSADDDDALSALMGVGRRIDMTPAAAVADALRDIRLHELASMAAMQSAARAMLNGFDPTAIRAAADQSGGMTVLPAQKKARAWDAFEALHGKTVQALNDDFDSVFGKAFARAYEEAMHEISSRDRK